MSKSEVVDLRTGREQVMQDRFAKILYKLGRVRYLTRDMRAEDDLEIEEAPKKRGRPAKKKAEE